MTNRRATEAVDRGPSGHLRQPAAVRRCPHRHVRRLATDPAGCQARRSCTGGRRLSEVIEPVAPRGHNGARDQHACNGDDQADESADFLLPRALILPGADDKRKTAPVQKQKKLGLLEDQKELSGPFTITEHVQSF